MYFIISIVLFIASIVLYNHGGNFEDFWKLLLVSGLFGLCDSISSLSLKKFLEEISRFKPNQDKENIQK